MVFCCRDDGDVQGNPLVAGFQEDLASDDDLRTTDRPVTNVAMHAEPSSDEDASKTDLRPSPKHKDSLTARSIGRSGLQGSDRQLSGERVKTSAGSNVPADSSEDEGQHCGATVRQDVDISDEELARQQHKSPQLSSEQVCTVYYPKVKATRTCKIKKCCRKLVKGCKFFCMFSISMLLQPVTSARCVELHINNVDGDIMA